MSEEVKQIYHCAQCGEVFKSQVKPVKELVCSYCGKSPVRTKFAQMTKMPDHATLDLGHGVARKNFVSMQRKSTKRRVMAVYAGCVVFLLVIGVVGSLIKEEKRIDNNDKSLLSRGSWQFEEKEKGAAQLCEAIFVKYARARSGNTKARYMVDGIDYLLDMRRYYANSLNRIVNFGSARMTDYRLKDDDGLERLDAKFEILREGKVVRKFEAVFWKQNDKWLLDWGHFVRIGEMPWGNFIGDSNVSIPQRFRLYVREAKIESTVVGYTDLVFANPLNDKLKPYDSKATVIVKDNTQLKEDILKHINSKKKVMTDKSYILGELDPSIMFRVQVTIGYEFINGEKRLVLKELNEKDWLATPRF